MQAHQPQRLGEVAVPLLAVPAGIVSLLWAGWELPLLATAFGGLAATAVGVACVALLRAVGF